MMVEDFISKDFVLETYAEDFPFHPMVHFLARKDWKDSLARDTGMRPSGLLL
jgi:hypothetical protein